MLYFINRTYTGDDWELVTPASPSQPYLALNSSKFPSQRDTIIFPGNIDQSNVAVNIKSYSLKFNNSSSYAPDSIYIASGGPLFPDAISIKIQPLLQMTSGSNSIDISGSMLSLCIIASELITS